MNYHTKNLLADERDRLEQEQVRIMLGAMGRMVDITAEYEEAHSDFLDLQRTVAGCDAANMLVANEKRKLDDIAGQFAKAQDELEEARRSRTRLQADIEKLDELRGVPVVHKTAVTVVRVRAR